MRTSPPHLRRTATAKAGTRCNCARMKDSEFCMVHDQRAETIALRNRSRGTGGRNNHAVAPWKPSPELVGKRLKNAKDVRDLPLQVLSDLKEGAVDMKVANGILFGCRIALTAIEKAKECEPAYTLIEAELRALKQIADNGTSPTVRLRALQQVEQLRLNAMAAVRTGGRGAEYAAG